MTIAPHSTASGFLFYDVKEIDDPLLKGAEIYVKQVHIADGKHVELFGFTVPFDKYLAAQKAASSLQKVDEAKKDRDSNKSEPMTVDTSHLATVQAR